jgi:hypothetical protein
VAAAAAAVPLDPDELADSEDFAFLDRDFPVSGFLSEVVSSLAPAEPRAASAISPATGSLYRSPWYALTINITHRIKTAMPIMAPKNPPTNGIQLNSKATTVSAPNVTIDCMAWKRTVWFFCSSTSITMPDIQNPT